MLVRLTVREGMLAVVLVGVCLALGRVHISLGSFAFGVLSVAWDRTVRVIRVRRAAGLATSSGRACWIAVGATADAILLLILCLLAGSALLPHFLAWRYPSHTNFYTSSALLWYLALAGALSIPIVRLSHRFGPAHALSSTDQGRVGEQEMERV